VTPSGAFAETAVDAPAQSNGLPLYGGHGLNFADFTGGGGACPMRGGDWADYPKASGGSGWPTQLQEMPPQCDAIVNPKPYTLQPTAFTLKPKP